jgi:hypothetical protein
MMVSSLQIRSVSIGLTDGDGRYYRDVSSFEKGYHGGEKGDGMRVVVVQVFGRVFSGGCVADV